MEPTFTVDELLRIERSAWHYARKHFKEARLISPGRAHSGIRDWYVKRAMWHRNYAKQMRDMRLGLCTSTVK